MILIFDFVDVESANDETTATTYYGGSFQVNGRRFSATGNDRGGGIDHCICIAVEELLGRELTEGQKEGALLQ